MIKKIINSECDNLWSIISEYEEQGYDLDERNIEFRIEYIVDIDNLSVKRTYSLVSTYRDDGKLYDDEYIWKGESLDDDTLIGFQHPDMESCPEMKGRISGINVMKIHHFLPMKIWIVSE